MENGQKKQDNASVFIALNSENFPLRINIGRDGEDEFLEFVRQEVIENIGKNPIPDNMMIYYSLPIADMPRHTGDAKKFFMQLVSAVAQQNTKAERIIGLRNAADKFVKGEDLFFDRLRSKEDTARSLEKVNNTLIVMDKEIMLVDHSEEGKKDLNTVLQKIADTFFDPKFPFSDLKKYEYSGPPINLGVKGPCAFLSFDKDNERFNILIDAVKAAGGTCKEYDFSPTAENFWKFVDPKNGEWLQISDRNMNIALLSQIAGSEKYDPAVFQNREGLYKFKHLEEFYDVANRIESSRDEPEKEKHRIYGAGLAKLILSTDYPNIRRPRNDKQEKAVKPVLQRKSIRVDASPKKDKPGIPRPKIKR